METTRSESLSALNAAYWEEVRKLLQTRHGLTGTAASKAVRIFRRTMAEEGVGDILYHAPVGEVSQAIFAGGYAEQEEVRPARPKPVTLPKWGAKKAAVKKPAAAVKKPSRSYRAASRSEHPAMAKPPAKKAAAKAPS